MEPDIQPLNIGMAAVLHDENHRYFPNKATFVFQTPIIPGDPWEIDPDGDYVDLFFDAVVAIADSNFVLSKEILKELVLNQNEMSSSAISYLPHVYYMLDLDTDDLVDFLSQIEHEDLIYIRDETIATARKLNREFEESIILYEELKDSLPPEELGKQLLDEVMILYCQMKLDEQNGRSSGELNEFCYDEFFEQKASILSRLGRPEPDDPVVIHRTELFPNFPNPFNPDTTIRFNMKEAGNVSIEVFNIRGQKVNVLFDGMLDSGQHSVIWHGVDSNGRSVGSGVDRKSVV
jgi:hypothetical protein